MDPFTDPSLTPSCGLQASMLVAALCLDYKVYDTQIWNGVLQQLVHFGLVRHPLLFIIPPANFAGVYSDPYVRPSVCPHL